MNNKYFSFVLSSVFLHDCWKSPTSLAIHFRMNLGSKQLNNEPRRWMECSWGRLAGIHIPMGTLQHWELWDTKRQVCGSCGANCKWSKVSEKCMEHCWPKKALQRTIKVSALAQRDWNQHCLILSYSCPGLKPDGPLNSRATNVNSLQESDQGVLLLQLIFILISSSLILKKMTSEGFTQSPLLSSFLPLQLSLSFPMKRTQTQCIFIILHCTFFYCLKCTLETWWTH